MTPMEHGTGEWRVFWNRREEFVLMTTLRILSGLGVKIVIATDVNNSIPMAYTNV